MNLNLGSGTLCYDNAVNLDRVGLPGVDVIHDLDVMPWPFGSCTFDEVWGTQVFEHVADPVGFMAEVWRVLTPGGLCFLTVPYWRSENAFTDPTHRRFCTERTFDYWCPGTALHAQFGAQYAGRCVFDKEQVTVADEDLVVRLRKRG